MKVSAKKNYTPMKVLPPWLQKQKLILAEIFWGFESRQIGNYLDVYARYKVLFKIDENPLQIIDARWLSILSSFQKKLRHTK